MLRTQGFAMVLALTLALAASSAVLPIIPLQDMHPRDACYFICDLCLSEGPDADLLECANNVCGHIGTDSACSPARDFGMLWLGHKCQDFDLVMRHLGNNVPGHKSPSA